METEEQLLPKEILARAVKSIGLGIEGGQVQFILPDGTCELYWLNYNTAERKSGESWEQYCDRTAKECIDTFQKLINTTDFEQEGILNFDFLKSKAAEGVEINQYLTFILYFNDHETWMHK